MALKKNPQAQFESDDGLDNDVAVAEAPAEQAAVSEVAVEAAAPAQTSVAIPRKTGVSLSSGPLVPALSELKEAFRVDWDTFKRLVAGLGSIDDEDENTLGEWVEMHLFSWQYNWEVVPGSQDEEAKKHLGYSSDGVTIDATGISVNEHLQHLHSIGYDKASVKQKLVLVGSLLASDKPSDLVGETVQLSLAPQSRKTFERYCFDRTVKARLTGAPVEGAERIRIVAHRKVTGTNKWTLLECQPSKLA